MDRHLHFLGLISFILLVPACSSVIVEPDERDPPGSDPDCVPGAIVTLGFDEISSASFVGDHLHIEGIDDGQARYVIVEPVSSSRGRLVETRNDLLGGARWVRHHDGTYLRIRDSAIETLSVGRQVIVTQVYDLPAPTADGHQAVGVAGDSVYLCLDPEGDAPPALEGFTFFGSTLQATGTIASCGAPGSQSTTNGKLWVEWQPDGVTLIDLEQGAIVESHGWNMDGVHQYGGVTALKTDGNIVATTLENRAYSFLYYADDSLPGVVYSSFGAGPKKLLGVNDGLATVAVDAEESVVVDVFAIASPPEPEQPVPHAGHRFTLHAATGGHEAIKTLAWRWDALFVTDGSSQYLLQPWDEELDPFVIEDLEAPRDCGAD